MIGRDDDITPEMYKGQLTEEQLEKILQSKIDPQNANDAMAYVAKLIASAKASPTEAELSQEASIIMRFREVQSEGSISGIGPERKRRLLSKLLTAKVIAAALATTALSGTAVAAYDGVLPSSVQNTLSRGLSAVGVSVPSSNSSQTSLKLTATQETTTTLPGASQKGITNGVDQGLASGESLFGPCAAYANSSSTSSDGTSSSSSSGGTTTTTAPSSTTTAAAAATTTTTVGSTSTTSSGTSEFQRLQTYASQKGETVTQLCANVSHPNPSSAAKSAGEKIGASRASSNKSSHSPFSTATTEATQNGTSTTSASSHKNQAVSGSDSTQASSDRGSAHVNGNVGIRQSIGH